MDRKTVLSLILSENEIAIFKDWLEDQYQEMKDLEAGSDLACALDVLLEDLGVEGHYAS